MMEKDGRQSELRMSDNRGLPSLRKAHSAAKPIIALSKVQLDRNMGGMQYANSKIPREVISSLSQKRLGSDMLTAHLANNQLSKIYKKIEPALDKNKTLGLGRHKSYSITNISTQAKDPVEKALPAPLIDKAKISSKVVGAIRGYSVNSHAGPLNNINEDRICVVTNLNKSQTREQQISFFSIYDGEGGAFKAEYFRDHFHNVLVKDKNFPADIEVSMRRALTVMQQGFAKAYNQVEGDSPPKTSILLAIIVEQSAYIVSVGDNKVVVSSNFAQVIHNPLSEKQDNRRSLGKARNSVGSNSHRIALDIVKLQVKDLDFAVLGSEGLFQNFSEQALGTRIWRKFLSKTHEDFHHLLGETTNCLMAEVFQEMSTKNVSLVLIAFKNLEDCFGNSPGPLQLPFVAANQMPANEEV